MDKQKISWWAAHRPTRRRLIQFYAALLYNAYIRGFIKGDIYTGALKNGCVPGLNCYSCPGAIGACPLGALQNALNASGKRAPWFMLGILMLYAVILGRTICGWLCPFGLIQELLHKIPTPKLKKSRATRALSWLKYAILAVFAVAIPIYYGTQGMAFPAFCKFICPAGTAEGAVGLMSNPVNADKLSMLNILFTRKFIIMIAILAASVFIYRMFCRFLCPLGAIYGLFAKLSILGVKVEQNSCIDCGRCISKCKMDIRRVGDHECIHCGECIDICPTGAISFGAGGIRLKKNDCPPGGKRHNRARRIIAWAAAILVLAGVMWYVNRDTAAPQIQENIETADDVPIGNGVGMRCPDFALPLYGGGEFSPADSIGKITVINVWQTYCGPCVAELPHFQKLHDAYGDDVSMVAIHTQLVLDDVDEFIAENGYTIPFALDQDGTVVPALGGSTQFPMTVILDRSGTIVYNQVGSVTYELLESIIKANL